MLTLALSERDRERLSLFVDEMRAMRAERGWSRAELAAQAQYSESLIAMVETYQRAPTQALPRHHQPRRHRPGRPRRSPGPLYRLPRLTPPPSLTAPPSQRHLRAPTPPVTHKRPISISGPIRSQSPQKIFGGTALPGALMPKILETPQPPLASPSGLPPPVRDPGPPTTHRLVVTTGRL